MTADSSPPSLLVNPRSFRASRWGLAARAMRLARRHGLDTSEVTDPRSVSEKLDQLRARGVQQLWMLCGDGTILALTEYLAEKAPDWSPSLLLLGGGRANVVPRDVGGYPPMRALRQALAARRAGRPLREETLCTLRVRQSGQPDRHGFVWVGALVFEAVRLAAAHRAAGGSWLHRSWIADPWVLLRWTFRTKVLRIPVPAWPPVQVQMHPADGADQLTGYMRAMIASTLQMRDALYNPFARRGRGPVRFTALTLQSPKTWRMLPALLMGRFKDSHTPERGVLSGRTEQVHLLGVTGFALDGELYTADASLPLVLSAGRTLRVLRPAP